MRTRIRAIWTAKCVFPLLFALALNAHAANTIQTENAKAGTSDWVISNSKYAANHEIEGYASLTSVNRGGRIQFFVKTAADPRFSIEFFRTGWYGGAGARRMTDATVLSSTPQPNCSNDLVTGLIECAWNNPFSLQIPNTKDATDWASGVYLAKLTAEPSGKQAYIVFVVRDDSRPSDYLFQSSVNTYQAYNNWGGRSLYAYNSDFQARKVSFNRPYLESQGAGEYLNNWEYPAVRFLEREGYDVTYATDVDLHESSSLLLSHKADLIFGHGEYWSWEMRTTFTAARDKGISLGVFAANTCYWQVRYEPSVAGGSANRTMVGYKDKALTQDPDYIGGNMSLYRYVTTKWRSPPVNMPEDALLGVMFGNEITSGDIIVANASNWVFDGTGLENGAALPKLLGVEVDGLADNTPPGTILLAHSPYQAAGIAATQYSDMTVYTASSGATVFASGTIAWSRGLDSYHGGTANPAAQQITRNLLARFVAKTKTPSIDLTTTANTQSVAAGHTANYDLQLVPTEFSGNVAISCSGAPAGATCTASPAAIAVSGDRPVPFTVSVTTPARTTGFVQISTPRFTRTPWVLPFAALLFMSWLASVRCCRPRWKPIFALFALSLIVLGGCAGATSTNGINPTPAPTATPTTTTATSTLTITATSGATQTALPLTLIVY